MAYRQVGHKPYTIIPRITERRNLAADCVWWVWCIFCSCPLLADILTWSRRLSRCRITNMAVIFNHLPFWVYINISPTILISIICISEISNFFSFTYIILGSPSIDIKGYCNTSTSSPVSPAPSIWLCIWKVPKSNIAKSKGSLTFIIWTFWIIWSSLTVNYSRTWGSIYYRRGVNIRSCWTWEIVSSPAIELTTDCTNINNYLCNTCWSCLLHRSYNIREGDSKAQIVWCFWRISQRKLICWGETIWDRYGAWALISFKPSFYWETTKSSISIDSNIDIISCIADSCCSNINNIWIQRNSNFQIKVLAFSSS